MTIILLLFLYSLCVYPLMIIWIFKKYFYCCLCLFLIFIFWFHHDMPKCISLFIEISRIFLICGRKMLWRVKNSIIDSKFYLSFILSLFCFSLSLYIYIWLGSELHEVSFVYFPFYIVNVSFYFLFIIIYLSYLQWAPLFWTMKHFFVSRSSY